MSPAARQRTLELLREVTDAIDNIEEDVDTWSALRDAEKALKAILLEHAEAEASNELMSRPGLR